MIDYTDFVMKLSLDILKLQSWHLHAWQNLESRLHR